MGSNEIDWSKPLDVTAFVFDEPVEHNNVHAVVSRTPEGIALNGWVGDDQEREPLVTEAEYPGHAPDAPPRKVLHLVDPETSNGIAIALDDNGLPFAWFGLELVDLGQLDEGVPADWT